MSQRLLARFGSMNLQRPVISTRDGFWLTAPRAHFFNQCIAQYYDHMVGSTGDKAVSGAVVVGFVEPQGKRKGPR